MRRYIQVMVDGELRLYLRKLRKKLQEAEARGDDIAEAFDQLIREAMTDPSNWTAWDWSVWTSNKKIIDLNDEEFDLFLEEIPGEQETSHPGL